MSTSLNRAVIGFVASVISVFTFRQGMWELLHLFRLVLPPYPTTGVLLFGVSPDNRPVILGRGLGCRAWIGSPFAALVLSDVGLGFRSWTGRRFYCPPKRITDSGWLGRYDIPPLIPDQWLLGNWREV